LLAQVDDEQSKYLGGDIDHTHLVKGLDLALLERVRAGDMQQESVTDQQLEEFVFFLVNRLCYLMIS
jgi:IK cytokine